MSTRRALHSARLSYCDSSHGAAAADRALMECLARRGFAVEALRDSVVNVGNEKRGSVPPGGPAACPLRPAAVDSSS